MPKGINVVILIGNLGANPEIRYTTAGKAVTTVSLATTSTWKSKDKGETNEKTEWHRVVFFGRLAEISNDFLKKGSKIYIQGRLQTRKWQDRDGRDRHTTEIVANEMQVLDKKPKDFVQPKKNSKHTDIPADIIDNNDDIPF